MTVKVLFSADAKHFADWGDSLNAALEEARVKSEIDFACDDPAKYDYVVYSPDGGLHDFSGFVNLKAVLSLWAGVETLASNSTIGCPICRMVDPGMIEGMTEWVVGQVLRHHLDFDRFLDAKPGEWLQHLGPPLARDRTVAVLGLGQLGSDCARALYSLNFRVLGWSRTVKNIRGIDCRSGNDGLESAVSEADILVLLLPHTNDTENICNASLFAKCRRGVVLINSGRGALVDEGDLVAAIDNGTVSHATLDVFRQEPLPAQHPFWTHPKISVWPHIASETRFRTASQVIAENMRRGGAGEPFLHVVDRQRGY